MTKSADYKYFVFVHKNNLKDAKGWCQEHIGPQWFATVNNDAGWYVVWAGFDEMRGYAYEFCFCDQEIATLFKLRWG